MVDLTQLIMVVVWVLPAARMLLVVLRPVGVDGGLCCCCHASYVSIFSGVSWCRSCCYACSSSSLGGRCVAVSLCSWCCHGSSLLFDDARCLPNLLIVSDSHGGALSQGSCCQSLVVVAPELCREVRYARQCGALGCLISLGIVIPRRQRLLVPPMGSSIGMLARLGFVLGVLFSSFIIFLLVWFSALFSS